MIKIREAVVRLRGHDQSTKYFLMKITKGNNTFFSWIDEAGNDIGVEAQGIRIATDKLREKFGWKDGNCTILISKIRRSE